MAGRRVVILAAGSRGDVQPCVALGRGLAARGSSVRVAGIGDYERLVTDAGLEFGRLHGSLSDLMAGEEMRRWLDGGQNPVKFALNLKRLLASLAAPLLRDVAAACRDADLILYPTIGFLGEHMGERLGIPRALIHFQPNQPTRAFPHPLIPQAHLLGPLGNEWSFRAFDQIAWQALRPILNPWRQQSLGLPGMPLRGPMTRLRQARQPVLCCVSPAVVPRPADWPPYVHLTGYWFLDPAPNWTPDPRLADFVSAGPPPVYVGFGSMVPRDPADTQRIVRAALRQAGVRGVLLAAPPHEPPVDDDVFVVDDVPHTWLFPRMAAVVHHGGAGTTAAGLRAGAPTVVCPFFGDQAYWGRRVAALGAGPRPLPIRRLTVSGLAAAIRQAVGDPRIRRRAAELGRRISAENGVSNACAALDGTTRRPEGA
ncbi:glycosyltransferase [Actinomadura vinacea]|uniref:Glycosyltransferase n=1 Tax=Actinomadura vinacea TaxID=115336 RepID=A0ABN3JGX1_9ACTN